MLLKTLDILIGLALIMLLASMAVTVLTQMFTALRNWRGKHLCDGIVSIVAQIDPGLRKSAPQIAQAVLTHPLVGQINGKLGGVIQREELIRVLLELASGAAPAPRNGGRWAKLLRALAGDPDPQMLAAVHQQELAAALARNGLSNCAEALQRIEVLAMTLEARNPEMATAVRQATATIRGASSRFVARVNTWFDDTMDRVTQAFVADTRKVTAIFALLVALGLQLDTFDLLHRLAIDDQLRKDLVAESSRVLEQYEKAPGTPPADLAEARKRVNEQVQNLSSTAYDLWPKDWMGSWHPGKIPGILLSTILLSLGAPFWYNALKTLVRLRPLLSSKEEADRDERRARQEKTPETPSGDS